jgi:transcriptional regulator NrdR family protein
VYREFSDVNQFVDALQSLGKPTNDPDTGAPVKVGNE